MTPEERKQIEARLEAARKADARIQRLEKALAEISKSGAKRLSIPLVDSLDDPDVHYSDSDGGRISEWKWHRVCWTKEEPGIVKELLAAVTAILTSRLTEAKHELEAA